MRGARVTGLLFLSGVLWAAGCCYKEESYGYSREIRIGKTGCQTFLGNNVCPAPCDTPGPIGPEERAAAPRQLSEPRALPRAGNSVAAKEPSPPASASEPEASRAASAANAKQENTSHGLLGWYLRPGRLTKPVPASAAEPVRRPLVNVKHEGAPAALPGPALPPADAVPMSEAEPPRRTSLLHVRPQRTLSGAPASVQSPPELLAVPEPAAPRRAALPNVKPQPMLLDPLAPPWLQRESVSVTEAEAPREPVPLAVPPVMKIDDTLPASPPPNASSAHLLKPLSN